MVRRVAKRSLRAASCCKVDVVKGAVGLRLRCFFSSRLTVSIPCASSNRRCFAALARALVFKSNCLTRLPSRVCKRPLKACFCLSTNAVIVQYSFGIKASMACSRSTIMRNAGLCTRPADKLGLIFFHNNGDKLKPTK